MGSELDKGNRFYVGSGKRSVFIKGAGEFGLGLSQDTMRTRSFGKGVFRRNSAVRLVSAVRRLQTRLESPPTNISGRFQDFFHPVPAVDVKARNKCITEISISFSPDLLREDLTRPAVSGAILKRKKFLSNMGSMKNG